MLGMPYYQPDIAHYADIVRDTVARSQIGPGQACEAFAAALRDYTGSPHVVLTNSGTSALYVIARVLADGLYGRTHAVLPAYGFSGTDRAFRTAGWNVEFCDVDLETNCVDPGRLRDLGQPSVVCWTNFSGYTGYQLQETASYCATENVDLVEDACQAIGHWWDGKHAGTFGRMGALSFSVPKLITTGQGGAILCRDGADFSRCLSYVDPHKHGLQPWGLNPWGLNLRMSDMQAALGLAQLHDLDRILRKRRDQCAALGLESLPSGPPLHNLVRIPGVSLARHSDERRYGAVDGQAPIACRLADENLFLPYGLGMSDAEVEKVGHVIADLRATHTPTGGLVP